MDFCLKDFFASVAIFVFTGSLLDKDFSSHSALAFNLEYRNQISNVLYYNPNIYVIHTKCRFNSKSYYNSFRS